MTYQRTNTIMNAYNTILWSFIETTQNRFKSGISAFNYKVWLIKIKAITQRFPEIDKRFGKYQDNLNGFIKTQDFINGMHQNRLSGNVQELFGNFGFHPFSLSPGNNDHISIQNNDFREFNPEVKC